MQLLWPLLPVVVDLHIHSKKDAHLLLSAFFTRSVMNGINSVALSLDNFTFSRWYLTLWVLNCPSP